MSTRITIPIAGMTCGACVEAVRNALTAVPGSRAEEVKVGAAIVSYDAMRASPVDLVRAIRGAGYQPVAANSQAYGGLGAGRGGHCCGPMAPDPPSGRRQIAL